MKGKLIFLLTMMSQQAIGVQGQDFASRFMHEVQKDTTIRCETISPKMLETLVKTKEEEKEKTKSLISKLKSVRIINPIQPPVLTPITFCQYQNLISNLRKRRNSIINQIDIHLLGILTHKIPIWSKFGFVLD